MPTFFFCFASISKTLLGWTALHLSIIEFVYDDRDLFSIVLGLTGFDWVFLGLPAFSRLSMGSTGFYQVLSGFRGFCLVWLASPGFSWVSLGFSGFDKVLPGFWWLLLGFTGFYWVLLGFTGSRGLVMLCSWVFPAGVGYQWVIYWDDTSFFFGLFRDKSDGKFKTNKQKERTSRFVDVFHSPKWKPNWFDRETFTGLCEQQQDEQRGKT